MDSYAESLLVVTLSRWVWIWWRGPGYIMYPLIMSVIGGRFWFVCPISNMVLTRWSMLTLHYWTLQVIVGSQASILRGIYVQYGLYNATCIRTQTELYIFIYNNSIKLVLKCIWQAHKISNYKLNNLVSKQYILVTKSIVLTNCGAHKS